MKIHISPDRTDPLPVPARFSFVFAAHVRRRVVRAISLTNVLLRSRHVEITRKIKKIKIQLSQLTHWAAYC